MAKTFNATFGKFPDEFTSYEAMRQWQVPRPTALRRLMGLVCAGKLVGKKLGGIYVFSKLETGEKDG